MEFMIGAKICIDSDIRGEMNEYLSVNIIHIYVSIPDRLNAIPAT